MELYHIFIIIVLVTVGTEMIAHAFRNMEGGTTKRRVVALIGIILLAVVFFFIYADTFLWS